MTTTIAPPLWVAPPATSPGPSVLTGLPIIDDPDVHWRNGVEARSLMCGTPPGFATHACPDPDDLGDAQPGYGSVITGEPFTIVKKYDCSPAGFPATEARDAAVAMFVANESTSIAGYLAGQLFPVLAASNVYASGADVADPTEVLAAAEYRRVGYGGTVLLHAAPFLVARMAQAQLLTGDARRDGYLTAVTGGVRVVIDPTYGLMWDGPSGDHPGGGSGSITSFWTYVTGAITLYRSAVEVPGAEGETIDRTFNLREVIVQRTYVPLIDCVTPLAINFNAAPVASS